MSKEQAQSLRELSEQELRVRLEQAIVSRDYQLQAQICYALLSYEERTSLALHEIKELQKLHTKLGGS